MGNERIDENAHLDGLNAAARAQDAASTLSG
jgi:hypothetical protein